MTRRICTAACTAVGIAMLAVATAATPRLSIVDLATLPGDTAAAANDVNNRGQIVGHSGGRPFIWEDGVMTELPSLPNEGFAVPRAINDFGQVVGHVGSTHAVLWDRGTLIDLVDTFDLQYPCTADAINNRGQVLGSCNGTAFIWEEGVVTFLPELPGGDLALANGINRFGHAVGGSQDVTDTFLQAVLWRDGSLVELAQAPRQHIQPGARHQHSRADRGHRSGRVRRQPARALA